MNLNQLELLRVLSETGFNLSKAAERMHVVQSAVSRQLQMLETELGAPLIERQGKKLVGFTALCERIMEEVEQINQARESIQNLSDDFLHNRNGVLHIATTHTQAKYLLPGPVRKFRLKYPDIKIYMAQSSPENLVAMLHRQEADVAICTEKLEEDGKLTVMPCYTWHHIAIVPENHELADGKVSLRRLAGQPILTYSPGFTGRTAIENAFSGAGLELDVKLSASDSDIIKTYVRLGMGVGIIASPSYEPERDRDLLALDLSGLIPASVTKIAYLKHHYLPGYCQYFVDELLKEAALKAAVINRQWPSREN